MKTYTLDWERYVQLARQAAAEGSVLLKNDNQTLPIVKGETVSVFGRIQLDYYKSGTGSGGMVNVNYVHSILDGLKACEEIHLNQTLLTCYEQWVQEHPFDKGIGWGNEPCSQEEMPLDEQCVHDAASESDIAVVIIGRSAGEDHDNAAEAGSYYLSDLEKDMLDKVCRHFKRTAVVLNVGNIIDMSWVDTYRPGAVLYVWQGGMEGGMGASDVLTGKVSPSGKLSDTIACELSDYPSHHNFGDAKTNLYQEDIYVGYRYFETFAKEKVVYPFGFGLSYTSFSIDSKMKKMQETIEFDITIKNNGIVSGKEVVQVYYMPPQGKLGKPLRNLAAFTKTKELQPDEEQTVHMTIEQSELASYDDSGVTGYQFSYVLEAGSYEFYVGTDVRSAESVGAFHVPKTTEVCKLSQAMAPVQEFARMKPDEDAGQMSVSYESVPLRMIDPINRRQSECPDSLPYIGDRGYKLADVQTGQVSIDDFVAQLSNEELCYMVRGEGMCSAKVTPGTASAFGGITPELQSFGIPICCCADGPSGIRMDCGTNAFSLPNGTLVACTFNLKLVADLFEMEGLEMRNNRIDTLLGPGINIHRHPLNGRNFEYHSEDPYLTGMMACAQLQGMHRAGVTGTIKHFCANNQEFKRSESNSVVSERALREIYLKGFELAVKKADASSIMTSYGAINGIWAAGNYDLNTQILRKEWGYQGIVMTDWWAKMNEEGEVPTADNRYSMVQSQNDLYMVVHDTVAEKDNLLEALADGRLSRGEVARCAANICNFIISSPAMERMNEEEQAVTIINKPVDQQLTSDFDMVYYSISEKTTIDLKDVDASQGTTHVMALTFDSQGKYRISLTASSELGELAQIPATLLWDEQPFIIYSFNGSEGKANTLAEERVVFNCNHYMRFYFPQNGLVLHEITFEQIME